jgi:hypothetical protein
MRLRLRALVPALLLGGALAAPPAAEADRYRDSDRGRRSGYQRSDRDRGHYESGRSQRSYRRSPTGPYGRSHRGPRYLPHHRRPAPYYRPYDRRYYRPYRGPRPLPRPHYAPWGGPYAYPGPFYAPRYRGGVHGSVSIGLPFFGFSLHF